MRIHHVSTLLVGLLCKSPTLQVKTFLSFRLFTYTTSYSQLFFYCVTTLVQYSASYQGNHGIL
jgi:hypothetical protein